ncbi:FAD-dependent oxidoreductase [Sediminispirochaeta bajacaliforniensis]|uniref:FAD-dependent oxidoreductase n=1 Tax=Sediminispirochaeta bajacaliforniensis TaxID=148 RepID=UPI0003600237|nr:FAD-dependent oxidoreductase [Sediminispirochaeta bajacaliforniensis]
MGKTKIVILGGGYGGVETAKKLHKQFKKRPEIEITLIDRNPYHTLMTELHEVAGARVEPDSVRVSFARIFSGKRVHIVLDEITAIDFTGKKLTGKSDSYEYDYLVLGTGAEPCFFGVPGAQEHAFTLWSFEDAMKIREHTERMFLEASQTSDPEERKKLLTFAVAGAGFTGIELAGELVERRSTLCREYGIDESEVRIMVVEALGEILPILPEKLQQKTMKYLEKHGVEICLESRITEVTPDGFSTNNCDSHDAKTFIWTCGVFGTAFGGELDLEQGHCSRQRVDEYLRSPGKENVFLTGDMVWFLENEKPLPQIVETALQTAEVVAHNIIASIEGSPMKAFKSNYHGFMVSIGGKYAVSHNMGMSMSGFFAMALKHLINVHYLLGLAGFNAVWGYLRHEILDIKEGRSLVRNLISAKIPNYWAFPLRLWLGLMWVIEGVNKIGEGWFHFSAGSKSAWMFSQGVVQAGVQAVTDATSAASAAEAGTQAAQTATEAVTAASGAATDAAATVAHAASDAVTAASGAAADAAANTVKAASDAVSAASDAVAGAASTAVAYAEQVFHTIWDTTNSILAYDNPLVTWFRQTFMDGIFVHLPFQLFQVMVVVTELGIGLALMGGLFTWLAAVVSIGMCLIFTLSGMFSWNQLWFVFAAILMMGGAGRGLGLDHWVMPWIKKWWNGTKLAKKSYLYSGEPK